MPVRLSSLVHQPDTVYLSLDAHLPEAEQHAYRCLPLTSVAAELIERMRGGYDPTLDEIRAVAVPHLPELGAQDAARLGGEELMLVLHHAAGHDVERLVDALLAAVGAGRDEDAPGKATARRTPPTAGRTARAGRATTGPTAGRPKPGRKRSAKR